MEHAGTAVAAAVRALAGRPRPLGHRSDRHPVRSRQQRRRRARGRPPARARGRVGHRRRSSRRRPARRARSAPATGTASRATTGSARSTCRTPATSRCSGTGIEKAAVIVDALLGTGVSGPLRDPIRSAVELIVKARAARHPGRRRRHPDRGRPLERRAVRARRPGRPHRHLPPAQDGARDPARRRPRGQGPRRADRHPARGRPWLSRTRPGASPAGARSLIVALAGRRGRARRWRSSRASCRRRSRRSSSTRRSRSSSSSSARAGCCGGSRAGRLDAAGTGRAARRRTAADPAAGRRRRRTSQPSPTSTWDVVIVGGGIVGCGALPRRRVARAAGGARRAGRHRVGDVVALVAADPRRAALPRAVPLRAGPRGARRAVAAARPRAAPRPPRAPALPDLRDPVRLQGVLRRRSDPVRRPRRAARRRLAPAPVRGATLELAPTLRTTACAAGCCTTTGSRTTPATRSRWLAPRSPPAARRSPGSARPAFAPVDGGRDRGASVPRTRDRRRPRDPDRARWSTRPASGRPSPTTRSAAARCGSCRAAARTSSCHARASRTPSG